jgi:hypothetical protein
LSHDHGVVAWQVVRPLRCRQEQSLPDADWGIQRSAATCRPWRQRSCSTLIATGQHVAPAAIRFPVPRPSAPPSAPASGAAPAVGRARSILPRSVPRYEPRLSRALAYLWYTEAMTGQEEGVKDRPCAVVLALRDEHDRTRVQDFKSSAPAAAHRGGRRVRDAMLTVFNAVSRSWVFSSGPTGENQTFRADCQIADAAAYYPWAAGTSTRSSRTLTRSTSPPIRSTRRDTEA